MTPDAPQPESLIHVEREVTLDDLRHKALAIRDTADVEVRRVLNQPRSRFVALGAVIVATAMSFAYLFGAWTTRSKARQRATRVMARAYRNGW